MKEKLISEFFESENIRYYSSLPVSECIMLYPRKLPEYTESVCFFLIPYYVRDEALSNISSYAVPRDYHLYTSQLEKRFLKFLSKKNEDFPCRIFSDNSPFCERSCAVSAGLGIRGKNGLLICPEYGSYTFIGSICLPFSLSITHIPENFNGDLCVNCEKCRVCCPVTAEKSTECLSSVTQKKKLTEKEAEIISKYPSKWGCDICQRACPYNDGVSETPIEFFKESRIPYLTKETLERMSDEEFSERAYSWRGKDVIIRNLDL